MLQFIGKYEGNVKEEMVMKAGVRTEGAGDLLHHWSVNPVLTATITARWT
jgi:GH24 family phage-related lysozyme (muramidase)